MTANPIGQGVTLNGITYPDWDVTLLLDDAIVAADVGKAVWIDSSAENTAKLAEDGEHILGRLNTYEDRDNEGIIVGAIALKGFMSFPTQTATKPTGDVTYASNWSADETVVINGVTWTAKASGPSTNEFLLGADLEETLDNLQTALNASANSSINVATYSSTATKLEVEYDTAGAAGNAFTLGAGTSGGTPSGATLSGGLDGVSVGQSIRGSSTAGKVKGVAYEGKTLVYELITRGGAEYAVVLLK